MDFKKAFMNLEIMNNQHIYSQR